MDDYKGSLSIPTSTADRMVDLSTTTVGGASRTTDFIGSLHDFQSTERVFYIDLNDFWEWRLQLLLWKYVPPILLIFGAVFNALTILVLLQRKFGKSSTRILLIVLALADSGRLFSGLFRHWVRVFFEFDLRTWTYLSCPVHVFSVYFFKHFSSWALMLITVERWISVSNPLKAGILCTRRSTYTILSVVILLVFILNAHMLYFLTITKEGSCYFRSFAYRSFWLNIWHWIDMSAYCGIPFTVVTFCNVSILYRIIRRNQAKFLQTPENKSNSVNLTSMTYMLTTVSVMFVLLTAPAAVYYILIGQLKIVTGHQSVKIYLAYAATHLIGYVNNTINFLLYCVSGRQFRREVYRMFRRIIAHDRTSIYQTDCQTFSETQPT
jgi:hypothetical protein